MTYNGGIDLDSKTAPLSAENELATHAGDTKTVRLGASKSSRGTSSFGLSPGDHLDQYRIMRPLGRGGMGEVYLARDTQLGRRVALKLVRNMGLETEEAHEQFMFEARATATFSHPNIVTIYGVGEHAGTPYVALEYLEGETLKQRIALRPLQLQEALRLGEAIARALEEAHDHRLLHRDLKPANIMLPPDGRVRVVDFGLASWTGPLSAAPSGRLDEFKSRSTVAGGTPSYMAPEQWLEQECSPATDIWALGVVLYESLTQRRPFEAASVEELGLEVAIRRAKAPSLGAHGEFPAALVDLVARCLTYEREERPSAREVAETLISLLNPRHRDLPDEEGPFRGLLPFQEDHESLFFGREDEVASLRERLRTQPILPVVGPSGAGKSSLVFAGLIPRLREAGQLTVLRLRPGATPFLSLAQRLARPDDSTRGSPRDDGVRDGWEDVVELAASLRAHERALGIRLQELALASHTRVLLVVDQLEEIAALVDDDDERAAFIEALCAAADDATDPVRVVLTLRHDFLDRVATSRRAREVFGHVAVVQQPSEDVLLRTLTAPVDAVGYRYDDPELPLEMVRAVAGEAACLPLLQFAAKSLWQRRNRVQKQLTRGAYDALGGVEGALASHADGVLEGLADEDLRVARELMLRMVTPARTRRVVRRAEALDGLGPAGERLLARLVEARLIHVVKARTADGRSEVRVELTHESLVTAWTTLARWLDESREEISFLRDVMQAAELWEKRGRRPTELWDGDALDDALRRLQRAATAVPAPVMRFLEAGRKRARAHQRRLRMGVVAALGLMAVIATVLLLQKRQADTLRERAIEARDQARDSQAMALSESARSALAERRLVEARAKVRVALETDDTPMARGLWWQVQRDLLQWRRSLGGAVYRLDFDPRGERVVASCQDKVAYLFDTTTGDARELHGHTDQVMAARFSPSGDRIVTAGYDGQLMFWARDATEPTAIWSPPVGGGVRSIVWVAEDEVVAGSFASGKLIHAKIGPSPVAPRILEGSAGIRALDHHPSHGLAVAANAEVAVWRWPDAELVATYDAKAPINDVAWLHDGRLVAGTDKGTFVLGPNGRVALPGSRPGVRGVAVTHEAGLIASGEADGALRIWKTDDLSLFDTREGGHASRIVGVAFSNDGRFVATGGNEQRINLWRTDRRTEAPAGHRGMVSAVAVSPDGTSVFSGGIDGKLRVWDRSTGEQRAVVDGNGFVRALSAHRSGEQSFLLSSEQGGSVRLFGLPGLETVVHITSPELRNIGSAAVDVSRRQIATVRESASLRLWSFEGEQTYAAPHHVDAARSIALSNDGSMIALGGVGLVVYDTRTGEERTRFVMQDGVRRVLFEPGDQTLLTVDIPGRLMRHHLKPSRSETLYRHEGRLLGLALAPRSRIAVASALGDITVLSSSGEVLDRRRGHIAEANDLALDEGGEVVATGGDDSSVRLWSLNGLTAAWRAPLLLDRPPRLVSHRGWTSPATGAPVARPESAWADAVDEAELARTKDGLLCLASRRGVALWRMADDRLLAEAKSFEPQDLEILGDGCAVLADSEVHLVRPGKPPLRIARDASALGRGAQQDLLVATLDGILRFGGDGRELGRQGVGRGVSALAMVGGSRALGYHNGTVMLERDGQSIALDATASARVTRLKAGPEGTVVVGFGDGTVGLWDTTRGDPIGHAKLHGPVMHLQMEADHLVAATSLGQSLDWDLSVFSRDYCSLMGDVWRAVPITWRHGTAVRQGPPSSHACATP